MNSIEKNKWLFFITGLLLFLSGLLGDTILGKTDRIIGPAQWGAIILGALLVAFSVIPLEKFREIYRCLLAKYRSLDNGIRSLYASRLFTAMVFVSISGFLLFPILKNQFAPGYSGLYLLMTEMISENNFVPPDTIPFYSQGDIPFVYPPLTFYIGALWMKMGLPLMAYIKFIPPLLGIACLIVFYHISLEITGRRSKALLSVIFLFSSYELYEKQITAAGMVRGWALLFCLLFLLFLIWSAKNPNNKWMIVLSSLCLGMTALSHFSYLAFALLISTIFVVFNTPRSYYKKFILILSLAFLIAMPYTINRLIQFGPQIYFNALSSHHNLSFIDLFTPGMILDSQLFFLQYWLGTPLLGITAIALLAGLWKRNWFLVSGIVFAYVILGEGERFVMILAFILLSSLLIDFFDHVNLTGKNRLSFSMIALSILYLLVNLYIVNYPKDWDKPALNESAVSMGDWLKKNSASESSFIFISDNHDLSEWVPYLTQRTSLMGPWGSEWKGSYEYELINWDQMRSCVARDSFECVSSLFTDNRYNPDYLISLKNSASINREIMEVGQWKRVFENDQFFVFQQTGG